MGWIAAGSGNFAFCSAGFMVKRQYVSQILPRGLIDENPDMACGRRIRPFFVLRLGNRL
jgi:hypothetical protein